AEGRKPFTVWLHLLTCVNSRHRQCKPTGLSQGTSISPRASTAKPELFASFQEGTHDSICVFGWTHYCQTVYLSWHFGHPVIEGSNGLTRNVELAHIEELDRFKRASLCLFQDVLRRRSRYLIPIQLAISQIASAGIADNFDVIPADFRLVRHPSSCHGSTNH